MKNPGSKTTQYTLTQNLNFCMKYEDGLWKLDNDCGSDYGNLYDMKVFFHI